MLRICYTIIISVIFLLAPLSISNGKKKPVSCYDKLVKLIKKSDFLETSGLYEAKYLKQTRRKLRKAVFGTEFDESSRLIIHIYLEVGGNEPHTATISWLSIDSGKKELAVMRGDQDQYAPVRCDTLLLKEVIHCIDWSNK